MHKAFASAVFICSTFTACCDTENLPKNIQALNSPSPKVRNQAALDLASCGESASKAVPRLGRLLYDENVGVQSSAAYALRKIDTDEAREILERAIARKRK